MSTRLQIKSEYEFVFFSLLYQSFLQEINIPIRDIRVSSTVSNNAAGGLVNPTGYFEHKKSCPRSDFLLNPTKWVTTGLREYSLAPIDHFFFIVHRIHRQSLFSVVSHEDLFPFFFVVDWFADASFCFKPSFRKPWRGWRYYSKKPFVRSSSFCFKF